MLLDSPARSASAEKTAVNLFAAQRHAVRFFLA
jgi:hypothetical protein